MRQFFVSICLAALLFIVISCKKETNSIPTLIQGVWELRTTSGMFSVTYPPGNGNTIKFTDNHYEIASNGQITKRGRYVIIRDLSASAETCLVIPDNKYTNRIIYDFMVNKKIFIQISDNKLTSLSGCFAIDGGSFKEYLKQ
jgi:hypothetical protein